MWAVLGPGGARRGTDSVSTTAIADYALLSDRHSAALVSRRRLDRLVVLPALRQPVDLRPTARRAGGPLVGAGAGRQRGHPSLRGSHHGVGDDLRHGHRDRGRRRRAGHGRGQPWPRAGPGRAAPPPAPGDRAAAARSRSSRVRPPTRVRPRGPRCSTRSTADWSPRAGPTSWSCRARCPMTVDGSSASGRLRLRQGERAGFALHHQQAGRRRGRHGSGAQSEIAARLDDTVAAWQSWSELHQAYVGPWHDLVHHSGRVLQALSFQPTGAICAAATTSLPEVVGGTRNWDYRYAWVRDASFTIEALWVAACPDEANEFFDYMTASAAGSLEQARRPADHVRHRRRARPDRAGAAAPAGLAAIGAGAGRQRRVAPAPARRLRRAARARCTGSPTDSSTPCGRVGPEADAGKWDAPPELAPSHPTVPRRARRHRRRGAGRRRTTASGRSAASRATSCTRS